MYLSIDNLQNAVIDPPGSEHDATGGMHRPQLQRNDQIALDNTAQRVLSVRSARESQRIPRLVTSSGRCRILAGRSDNLVDALGIVGWTAARISRCAGLRIADVHGRTGIVGTFVEHYVALVTTVAVFAVTRGLVAVTWGDEAGDVGRHRHRHRIVEDDTVVAFAVDA